MRFFFTAIEMHKMDNEITLPLAALTGLSSSIESKERR
jgi:hypothetical protein